MPPEGTEAEVIRGGGAAPGDDTEISESDFTVDSELLDLLNETRDFLER